jgi:hypothetical protein
MVLCPQNGLFMLRRAFLTGEFPISCPMKNIIFSKDFRLEVVS